MKKIDMFQSLLGKIIATRMSSRCLISLWFQSLLGKIIAVLPASISLCNGVSIPLR